jgi:hypothetical protein
MLGGNAHAGIAKGYFDPTLHLCTVDEKSSALGHGITSIAEEVGEDNPYLSRVANGRETQGREV